DSEVAGYRDRDMVSTSRPPIHTRLREDAEELEFYKLLKYLALALRFHPKSMDAYLRAQSKDRGSGSVDYGAIEPWTRVSPHDYESNLREMISLSRSHGIAVILLDNELWPESPYRTLLKAVAADTHVPLVDSLQLVADARVKMVRDIESRLVLVHSTAPHAPA